MNATGSYTWRDNLTLDRPAYFTDGQQFLTDQVQLPDVVDYGFSAGYFSPRFHLPISFTQQITRGGGDIRRQDMPFPSNRMNASRVGAMAMYYLPMNRNLALKASGSHAVSGRNVGQSTLFTAGVMYIFNVLRRGPELHANEPEHRTPPRRRRSPPRLRHERQLDRAAAAADAVGQDPGAGSWRMLVLNGPQDVIVPPPAT